MLSLKNVTIRAGNFCLEDISFEIKKEKAHVIIGQTGSGKTLLLETITGFRKLENGKILINDKDAKYIPIENRDIAYVPQDLALFRHLNVKKNILYSFAINKRKKLNKNLFNRLVKETGIEHLLDRKIKNLSGGEKQRVALVRALITENKLLILDEPFSAINETIKYELRLLLKKIQEEFKLTILSVTHDLDEAFFLGDRISVLSRGKILQTANKKELYFKPATVEVANFLGINNIFDAVVTKINNDVLSVFCKQLNTGIMMNYNKRKFDLKISDKIKFGIRNNDIMILREKTEETGQKNLLHGTIDIIIEKVSTCEIVIIPDNSAKRLLIEMPYYAYRKLEIKTNMKVKFIFKIENVFLLRD